MLEIVVAPSFACCYFQSTSALRSRIPFNGIEKIIIARLVNYGADASIGRSMIQLACIEYFIRAPGHVKVDARFLSQCTIRSDSYH